MGEFIFNYNGKIKFDVSTGTRMILTHPSYITKDLVFSEKTDTIFLVRKPHQLIEIALKPNAHDEFFELGYYHTKKWHQNRLGLNVS